MRCALADEIRVIVFEIPAGANAFRPARRIGARPSECTWSRTNLLRPWIMAASEMSDDTPMMMPSTVRAERALEERSVAKAARKFSRAWEEVMIAITQTSGRRWDPDLQHAMRDRFQ